jgi:hypothetical protein
MEQRDHLENLIPYLRYIFEVEDGNVIQRYTATFESIELMQGCIGINVRNRSGDVWFFPNAIIRGWKKKIE